MNFLTERHFNLMILIPSYLSNCHINAQDTKEILVSMVFIYGLCHQNDITSCHFAVIGSDERFQCDLPLRPITPVITKLESSSLAHFKSKNQQNTLIDKTG